MDKNNIKNLIVKKAIGKRCSNFMFWYNDKGHTDHTDYTEKSGDYSESSYQKDHVDYCDYQESFFHSDSSAIIHQDYIKGTFQDPNHSEAYWDNSYKDN